MSGWQLGLALFGCWLAGVVGCGASVYFYARHVFRSKVGQLAGLLTGAAAAGAKSPPAGMDP